MQIRQLLQLSGSNGTPSEVAAGNQVGGHSDALGSGVGFPAGGHLPEATTVSGGLEVWEIRKRGSSYATNSAWCEEDARSVQRQVKNDEGERCLYSVARGRPNGALCRRSSCHASSVLRASVGCDSAPATPRGLTVRMGCVVGPGKKNLFLHAGSLASWTFESTERGGLGGHPVQSWFRSFRRRLSPMRGCCWGKPT